MPSYKDIIRSLSTCLKDTSQIDEQRTQQTINLVEAYVDYQRASPADADSPATLDKFSADLGTLYHQELHANDLLELVSERSAANLLHAKHAFFLRVLHGLVPALTPARLIADWWDSALRPVLSSSHYTQEVVHECRSIVTDMLAGDDLPGIDFRSTIVELYLHQNTRPARTLGGINATAEAEEQLAHELQTVYAHLLENDWHRNLAAILMNLGAVKTKDFFILLNAYYIQSQYRLQVLYMLSEFIRRKRTHIHDMLDTPLFESILKSLMLDNSTTLIAISVTTLIMLLPRICTSLPRFLPRLFYIFARAICWDQLRDSKKRKDDRGFDEDPNVVTQSDSDVAAGDGQQGGGRAVPRKSFIVDGWDCLDYSVSKLSTPPSNPRTGPLFTCLYGLYPCNFVAFLHSPLAYLSKSEFKALEEFDERSFRTRTMPIVNRHMLHPNLVLMDETTELTDTSRWMKMEPPDVMAQCMSLDLTNAASRAAYDAGGATCKKEYEAQVWAEAGLVAPEVGPYMDAEGEEAEGEEASWKDKTVSEKEKDMSKQSEKEFTVREHGGATAVTMEEIIAVHKALKSGAEVAVGDDAWQSRMPTAATTTTFSSISASKPTVAGAVDVAAVTTASDYDRVLIASLEREVLLLRNELNFELFLRQQHLQHIGRLYREHMTDSSVEATREQLFNMNVMLRDSLKNLQAKYDQQSKEAASIKEKHLRWENDLQTKVKQYREDKKERVKDMERITEELREAKATLLVQSSQLDEARKRAFTLENGLKILQPKVEKLAECEERVEKLTKELLVWQDDTNRFQEQRRQMESLVSQWHGMELKLIASDEQVKDLSGLLTAKMTEADELAARVAELERSRGTWDGVLGDKMRLWNDERDQRRKDAERIKSELATLKQRNEELEVYPSSRAITTLPSIVSYHQESNPSKPPLPRYNSLISNRNSSLRTRPSSARKRRPRAELRPTLADPELAPSQLVAQA